MKINIQNAAKRICPILCALLILVTIVSPAIPAAAADEIDIPDNVENFVVSQLKSSGNYLYTMFLNQFLLGDITDATNFISVLYNLGFQDKCLVFAMNANYLYGVFWKTDGRLRVGTFVNKLGAIDASLVGIFSYSELEYVSDDSVHFVSDNRQIFFDASYATSAGYSNSYAVIRWADGGVSADGKYVLYERNDGTQYERQFNTGGYNSTYNYSGIDANYLTWQYKSIAVDNVSLFDYATGGKLDSFYVEPPAVITSTATGIEIKDYATSEIVGTYTWDGDGIFAGFSLGAKDYVEYPVGQSYAYFTEFPLALYLYTLDDVTVEMSNPIYDADGNLAATWTGQAPATFTVSDKGVGAVYTDGNTYSMNYTGLGNFLGIRYNGTRYSPGDTFTVTSSADIEFVVKNSLTIYDGETGEVLQTANGILPMWLEVNSKNLTAFFQDRSVSFQSFAVNKGKQIAGISTSMLYTEPQYTAGQSVKITDPADIYVFWSETPWLDAPDVTPGDVELIDPGSGDIWDQITNDRMDIQDYIDKINKMPTVNIIEYDFSIENIFGSSFDDANVFLSSIAGEGYLPQVLTSLGLAILIAVILFGSTR